MNIQELNEIPPWEWGEDARDLIVNVLNDKNALIEDRITATEMASNEVVMKDDMADHLMAVIQDTTEPDELRGKAAISLGPALEYGDMMGFEDDDDDFFLKEEKFNRVREFLRDIFQDESLSKNLRRRVLEAAVRAPMEWQQEAVQTAYDLDDDEWRLTAVFCMAYVPGFNEQIMKSLDDGDPEIFYQAVCAAGDRDVKEAWPYVEPLLAQEGIDKYLLMAAIHAAGVINPEEAMEMLVEYSEHADEDIADTAQEAIMMAGGLMDEPDFDDPDE